MQALGVLKQGGEQVGGFFEWEISHSLLTLPQRDKWTNYKEGGWRATGKRPWFLVKPDGDEFDVTFYSFLRGKLVEHHSVRVKGRLPSSYPLNEYLEFVLVMIKI